MNDVVFLNDWTTEELALLLPLKSYCAHISIEVERGACLVRDPFTPEPVLQISKQGGRYVVECFNGNYLAAGEFSLAVTLRPTP